MARRIGFGDGEKRERERAAREAAAERQKPTTHGAPSQPANPDAEGRPFPRSPIARVILGLFLIGWLSAWSIATLNVFAMLSDREAGAPTLFLYFWLAIAAVIGLFTLRIFWKLVTGQRLGTHKRKRKRSNWQERDGNHEHDDRGGPWGGEA